MSLRISPQLTPQLLDAARSNARHSTGPRSEVGKHHSRMNAVKHGERSDPENHYEVMRALGEDPARFEALKQELRGSFGTGDPLTEKQVDDLVYLHWQRERLERAQTGLMRRALLELEERQHRRRKEIEGATIEVGQAINLTLAEPTDPAARLRLLQSFLGVIRVQVQGRYFLAWQAAALEGFYKKKGGWRAARLCYLLALFAASGCPLPLGEAGSPSNGVAPLGGARPDGEDDLVEPVVEAAVGAPLGGAQPDGEGPSDAPPAATEPADELRYKELLRLLEEEMASVEEEFGYEEKLNEERTAIERDACLAPLGEEWRMLLRREEALDRAIDRKIKLLLTLRKSSTGTLAGVGGRTASSLETGKSACPTPISEEPSPLGRGCQAPAVSSAGA